jgi:SAM-dependent methyltransferase
VTSREFYHQVSQAYQDETFGEPATVTSVGRSLRTAAALAFLAQHSSRPSLVADIGCGPGQFAATLINRGHRYIGVDIVTEMFAGVAAALAHDGRAAFVAGRVEEIPLADMSVDAVICMGVIEYLENILPALLETRRILKPSGIAIVSFPNVLNPIHAARAGLRPLVAPLLRAIVPGLRKTVFVSGITHHTFAPRLFLRRAQQLKLLLLDAYCHGYLPSPFNHGLSTGSLALYLRLERLGQRLFPALGSNFVACLRKA